MEQIPVFAALDLGSTRFRAVVAEPDGKGGVAILGAASLPATGTLRGELDDLPRAAETLRELFDRACEEAEVDVTDVAVGVNGDHVRSLDSRGGVALEGGGVTVRDQHLGLALQRVQSMDVPFDRVILHCLPVDWRLDNLSGLRNPVGMVGARLELEAHLVTGEQSSLSAVHRAVEMAGLKPHPLVFGPCATSRYLIEDQEREQGCLLVDIGGEVTHYALFYRGCMRQSGVVPVGGNHVTRDLAWGLETDVVEAERLKCRFGAAFRRFAPTVPEAESSTESREVSPAVVARIAAIGEARQQEILELVAQGLQWGISRPPLAGGIVLTGGGSRLRGTAELAEQVFTLRATTRRAPGDDHGDEADSWSTALGLVQHLLEEQPAKQPRKAAVAPEHLFGNLRRWIVRLV